jgi:hypothetical protein
MRTALQDIRTEKVREFIAKAAFHKAAMFDAMATLEDITGKEVDLNSAVIHGAAMNIPRDIAPEDFEVSEVSDEQVAAFFTEVENSEPLTCADGSCQINHMEVL